MLPVETGGREELLAVEVRADADLHAFDALHKDEADRVLGRPAAFLQAQIGHEVGGVW